MPEEILVRKRGYDGREVFSWRGLLLGDDGDELVIQAPFVGRDRVDLGYVVLERGDLFLEFYYRSRWFNVFQVYAAGGALKGWYCNLSTPARVANGELDYRDLALDVFVRPDGTWVEDDRDEYDANVATLYAPEDVAAAERGLAELMALVRASRLPSRAFPGAGRPSP